MLKPEEAWNRLIGGEAEAVPIHPLDFSDHAQVARTVLIDGERWIVLVRRSGE